VRWIGHRTVQPARHPNWHDVAPVRIHVGAFGPGRPHCDLRLSPDHAVFIDGALIPIRYLINGATIAQEDAESVTYFHVELAAHDVILAEGLPAESFLDTGNRAAFANGGPAIEAHPDFARAPWDTAACAPLLLGGAALRAVQECLLREATGLGWTITAEPELVLRVGEHVVQPARSGGRYRFTLPPEAGQACLLSRRVVPAQIRPGADDSRGLGVAVAHLALDGRPVGLGDPHLAAGWHGQEAGWRWTDGAAMLRLDGARLLEVSLLPLTRYWCPPAALANRTEAGVRA
jgi:hypothetical protein